MIKQVVVTFEFDPETELVSNLICIVDGIEKKKKTTPRKKKEEIVEEMAAVSLITLEESKLVFNNRAVADLELEYEDRIVIKWEKVGKKLIPVIGKDEAFDEEGTGNKVTKTNTIGYKGKQNAVLAEFGNQFTIEVYKEGIWKLISTTNPNTSKVVEEKVKQIKPILVKEKEDDGIEIDVNMFKL